MTIINQKSISGITSITTAAAGDNLLTVHTNDGTERLRIDSSGNTRITAGIVTTLSATGDVDVADKIIHTGDTDTAIRFPAADTITAETGGSERLRVTATGLVGVNCTPLAQFQVKAGTNQNIALSSMSSEAAIEAYNDAGSANVSLRLRGSDFKFFTTSTERLRILSDGQVRIGSFGAPSNKNTVTPLSHVDGSGVSGGFQVNRHTSVGGGGAQLMLTATRGSSITGHTVLQSGDGIGTVEFAGSDGDEFVSAASIQAQVDTTPGDNDMPGRLIFKTTSDGASAPTERLRIDSNGRLLVNHTADVAPDGFESLIQTSGTDYRGGSISIRRDQNSSSGPSLLLTKSRSSSVGGNTIVQDNDSLGSVWFYGADGNDVSQAGARIECNVDATPGSNDMPGRLSFFVTSDGAASPVERMRINRRGFLKMGPRITDGSNGVADLDSFRHEFTSDNNGWTIIVTHTSGSSSEHEGILIDYKNSPNGTGNSFIQGNDSNGTRFRFASNGGLYNYQSNDSNLSDEREKKNIVSLDTKWDKVKSWELKKFHYNEDADSDDLRYGVIAQQVEEHCPEVLSEWVKQEAKDAVLDGDGNVVTPAQAEVVRKGVKEQQMMWMAIKALQEAQTRIETLETQNTAQQTQINDLITRVTALEG